MRVDNGIEDIYIGGDYNKKNKNNKFFIFIIISILIIIAVIAVWFYINHSTKNESKDLFNKSFYGNNIVKLSDTDFYKDIYQKVMTQNSGIDTTINFQMGASSQENRKIDLTKVSLDFATKSQVSGNKTSTDLSVKYSNNEFFKMNLLTTRNSFGIAQDEIVNKYIVTDYDTAKETMGIDVSKSKVRRFLSMEPSDLTKQEKEEYIKSIYDKMMASLAEDKFKTSNNIVLNNDGTSIPVTAYSLQLSQDEFKNYLINLLTMIRDDEELLDKILTNNNDILVNSYSDEPEEERGVTNIESIFVNGDENSNINVIINRVQNESSESEESDEDRSVSRRSTENMFNVDGDENSEEINRNQENSDTENNDSNNNNENNNDDNSNESEENQNHESNNNNENDDNNNHENTNSTSNGSNNNQNTNQTTDPESTRVTPANTSLESGIINNSGLSANVKNFNTSLSIDETISEISVEDVEEAERSNQELAVTNNTQKDTTIVASILDDLGIDDLQIIDLLNSEKLEDEKLLNFVRLILGIKIDTTKKDFQMNIDNYIDKVKKFKGNGLTVTVYVSEEKTEKISFVLPNSNTLDIEFLKRSDDENNIKFTYLYSGSNSQLFDIQESVTYSADEKINNNSEGNAKLNGFSLQIDKFLKDVNNNTKISYQKIEQEEVIEKFIVNVKSVGNANMDEIKNNINISVSAKGMPEEQYSISNTITFSIIPDIKGFTDENSVHLDELSAEDYDKLMIILQDKINQVKRDKEKSLNIIVSNDSGSLFNGNAFITNSLSKDDAREKVISGVKDLMRKAEEEERDFSLEDLNDLEIDGYNISKNITSDRAIIVIDVYSFSIDENFAISDVE